MVLLCVFVCNVCMHIKTHGSVSCSPRSRRATLWVYWQEENAIFTHSYLHAAFTKHHDVCCGHAHQRQYPTNQISAILLQAFPRYETSTIGLVSSFFFFVFSHTYKNCHKTWTQIWHTERGIEAHLGTKFGWNMINSQGGFNNYSRKIAPINIATSTG